jgi:hypothetical protein
MSSLESLQKRAPHAKFNRAKKRRADREVRRMARESWLSKMVDLYRRDLFNDFNFPALDKPLIRVSRKIQVEGRIFFLVTPCVIEIAEYINNSIHAAGILLHEILHDDDVTPLHWDHDEIYGRMAIKVGFADTYGGIASRALHERVKSLILEIRDCPFSSYCGEDGLCPHRMPDGSVPYCPMQAGDPDYYDIYSHPSQIDFDKLVNGSWKPLHIHDPYGLISGQLHGIVADPTLPALYHIHTTRQFASTKVIDRRGQYELWLLWVGYRKGMQPYLAIMDSSSDSQYLEIVDREIRTVEKALTWRNQMNQNPNN